MMDVKFEELAGLIKRPAFWFEGKQAWGQCSNELSRICLAYDIATVRTARLCRQSLLNPMPSFGFYGEHTERLTAGDYMKIHGIELDVACR